jgi:hypothetical protein
MRAPTLAEKRLSLSLYNPPGVCVHQGRQIKLIEVPPSASMREGRLVYPGIRVMLRTFFGRRIVLCEHRKPGGTHDHRAGN